MSVTPSFVVLGVLVVLGFVVDVIVVGTGARVADVDAPVPRVVGAVLLGSLLAMGAGVLLMPVGCCASAGMGWMGSLAVSLLVGVGAKAIAYRAVLGAPSGAALGIAVASMIIGALEAGVFYVFVGSWAALAG